MNQVKTFSVCSYRSSCFKEYTGIKRQTKAGPPIIGATMMARLSWQVLRVRHEKILQCDHLGSEPMVYMDFIKEYLTIPLFTIQITENRFNGVFTISNSTRSIQCSKIVTNSYE